MVSALVSLGRREPTPIPLPPDTEGAPGGTDVSSDHRASGIGHDGGAGGDGTVWELAGAVPEPSTLVLRLISLVSVGGVIVVMWLHALSWSGHARITVAKEFGRGFAQRRSMIT